MARTIKEKELENIKLAHNYGGWMYCTGCNTNIGYLCYTTYDEINFSFTCNCGEKGNLYINFQDSRPAVADTNSLQIVKNRWCCPKDQEPLITIMDAKLLQYRLQITCLKCNQIYFKEKEI